MSSRPGPARLCYSCTDFRNSGGPGTTSCAALSEAGFRAVAVDMRGYGASDKPPRGYDGYTMAADVAGLIRALGERDAVLVGAGYGGMMAWTTAAFHPKMVRHLIVSGAAHPLRVRAAIATDPRGQSASATPVLKFQIPRYEHVVTRDDAALVGEYLRRWGGADWVAGPDFADYERKCRTAMQIPQAAFCALEAYRWAFRSVLRLHGYRFVRLLQEPITVPTLQLHGAVDSAILPRTAQGSGRYVTARYEWRLHRRRRPLSARRGAGSGDRRDHRMDEGLS